MTTLDYLWSPNTCRHVVSQVKFAKGSKIDVPSTAVSRRSNILVLLDTEHRLQIFQQLRSIRQRRLRLVDLQHGFRNTNRGH